MFLKNKLNNLLSGLPKPLEYNKDEQIKKMNDLGLPNGLIDRSIKQYKAQFITLSRTERFVKNFVGFFGIPYFLFLGVLGNFTCGSKAKANSISNLTIFPYKNFHYPDIIPKEINEEFYVEKIDFMEEFLFELKDIKFIFKIVQSSPSSFYFISKCFSKLFFYRYIIYKFNPKAILSTSEYSFTSSIATHFCRENKVQHINLMHGEKFFFIRDSFFEFDRFYVWDDHYRNLFIELNAAPNQFRVGTFSHLNMRLTNDMKLYSFTYYLAAETNDELNNIRSTLLKIESIDKICVRYHPRYSRKDTIERIFNGFNVENPNEVSLEKSFSRTKSVISLYSSCLTQAFFNQIDVVIDDVNHSIEKVRKLQDLGFIIFSKPHTLLSSLLSQK